MEAVVLVGHGGVAADTPRELVTELKRLEASRRRTGLAEMSTREAEIDRLIREWPRTAQSDPYKVGLEAIADALRPRLGGGRRLAVAYNEFCAPSLEHAVAELIAGGAKKITVVTTMITPGGSHSEFELPAEVAALQRRHPDVTIEYAWPYRLDDVASFLLTHIDRR